MQYDVIIVGAGSAGAALAARLSEDRQCNALLLDAGPDYQRLEQLPDDIRNGYGLSVHHHDWHRPGVRSA